MEAKSGRLQHGICSSPLLPPFLQPLSKALHENTKYHDDRRIRLPAAVGEAKEGVGGAWWQQTELCLFAISRDYCLLS